MTNPEVQTGYAPINGAQIYYEVAGQGPETLVFLHAGVADHRLWDDQVTFFAPKYKVIRYDLRGFGKSEPVDGEFSRFEDHVALMNHLGVERAHFVGCSMGGMIAMDYAVEYPDKVASLTMVGSAPNGLALEVKDPAIFSEAEAAEEAKDWDKLLELETRIWFDGIGRTPEQVDPVKRAKAVEMNRAAFEHAKKALGKQKPPVVIFAGKRLDQLKAPLLVIVGAHDVPYILAASDYMAEHVPGARKVLLQNTAHLPSLELPDEVNRVLGEFLSNLK